MELVRIPLGDTLRSGEISDCSIWYSLYFCVLWDKPWRLVRTNLSNRPPPFRKALKLQFKVDDIVDAVTVIDQTGVPVDEDVAVAAGRRR